MSKHFGTGDREAWVEPDIVESSLQKNFRGGNVCPMNGFLLENWRKILHSGIDRLYYE